MVQDERPTLPPTAQETEALARAEEAFQAAEQGSWADKALAFYFAQDQATNTL